MPSIISLFKKENFKLYGLSAKIYLETRGMIDPPRGAALLTSSPDTLADLIGNQIGGALGGNANRPSDTIFRKKTIFAKPITLLAVTKGLLKYAVKAGNSYYVKDHPAPPSLIHKLLSGTSPANLAKDLAFQALDKIGDPNALKNLKKLIKDKSAEGEGFGPEHHRLQIGGKPISQIGLQKIGADTKTGARFSTHYIQYSPKKDKNTTATTYFRNVIKERKNTKGANGKSKWDLINDDILNHPWADKKEDTQKLLDKNLKLNIPYVLIEQYGKTGGDILLPGTISGIQESATPSVNAFKYVGSPFNLYRYSGVERSLQWEVKLYFYDRKTLLSMKKNLEKLRALVFPDEDISTITYKGDKKDTYAPLLYNPNLVYVTIDGLYDKMFGIIDTMNITIDDNVPWATATTNPNTGDGLDFGMFTGILAHVNKPHPVVVNVSMGMKIIETPGIVTESGKSKYIYNDYFNATQSDRYKSTVEKTQSDAAKRDKELAAKLEAEEKKRKAEEEANSIYDYDDD
jgi:hypothetical protein